MVLTQITPENMQGVETIIPEEIFYDLKYEGTYGVACVDETDSTRPVVMGCYVFSIDEGISYGVSFTICDLKWIYVLDAYRNRGVGQRLVYDLLDTISEVDEDVSVVCDLPLGPEYQPLEGFLSRWDFQFSIAELNIVYINRDNMIEAGLNRLGGEKKGHPLSEINPRLFANEMIRLMSYVLEYDYRYLSTRKEDYHPELSCYSMNGSQIDSLFLIRQRSPHLFEAFLLHGKGGGDNIRSMVAYTAKAFIDRNDSEAMLKIQLRSKASVQLVQYLFPEFRPIQVLRGVFDFGDEDENEDDNEDENVSIEGEEA